MRLSLLLALTLTASLAAADTPPALFVKAMQTMDKSGDLDTDKAISLLKRAAEGWETAAPKDPAYASALDYLAVVLMAQIRQKAARREDNGLSNFADWIKEAGPYTKRALSICESNPETKPEDLALALELEAQVDGQQGSGAALWERAARIRAKRVEALNPPSVEPTSEPADLPGDNATQPAPLSKVEPDYTAVARIALYRGKVTLRATIGADGKVRSIRLVRGLGFGLDEQAAIAIRQWVYHSPTRGGQPVSAAARIDINFDIR